MKFAAKRTWPEKSSAWEHEGEADDAQSFASEFVTIERLAVDTEFVVMARGGDGGEPRFFRVASTAPCRLEPAQARTGASAVADSVADDAGQDDEAPMAVPSIAPVISMLLYMGKVGFVATAGIALIALAIEYFR